MFGRKPEQTKRQQKLGQAVENMLVKDYIELLGNTQHLIWSSLIRGVFVGFGTIIGATVLIAVLLWLLSLGENVPFLERIFENLRNTIDKGKV
jgi:Fe2+ transport system protein B